MRRFDGETLLLTVASKSPLPVAGLVVAVRTLLL